MHCPKCGGEIPFYDLRANCKHCGVNIMYFSQEAGLIRDAKRTELEGAVARMVIARIKAAFIGSKAAIARMILTLGAIAVLMVPFASLKIQLPLYENSISAGLIGLISSATSGLLMKTPDLLQSALLGQHVRAFLVPVGILVVLLLLGLVILVVYLASFLRLEKMTRFIKNASLVGTVLALLGQIAVFVFANGSGLPETSVVNIHLGFGSLATAAVWFAMFMINRYMLKKGLEPKYRENDPKRREILKKVRAGEIDLDSLPLPVLEREDEREERIHALEEAMKAEEEGKEL